jgi:hypothetical protein
MRLVLCALLLLLAAIPAAAQLACGNWLANTSGTAKADITVSSTAVVVLAANGGRCRALISNYSANDMRCLSSGDGTGIPTTTAGYLVKGGTTLVLETESRRAVQCIRTGGSDATASVVEALP